MNLKHINELTKIAYNKTAQKYHDNFKNEIIQKEYDRLILDRLSDMLKPNSLICDAGCGPSGHIGKYLVDKGHRVVGIDISSQCIDIATVYNPEIDFKVMDMMESDFESNSFDAVISFYSILYTPKGYVNNLFSEFHRMLKKNGKLLIVVKRGSSEGIIEDEWYEGNKVYFTYFVEEEIKGYYSKALFNIDFLAVRDPYDFELAVERIYAIGTKI
ncbi:MAG TPA: class I SAM-dependent methyltransferase [Ohtaekwangia sp.]|nr:class I SAM-dependent methyltransferase [Ohtaekwangia sp.]